MQKNTSDNLSSTRPLTVAAGHPFIENSEKIQRCLIRRGGEFVGFQN
jgi:hypothetical protein